MKHFYKSYYSRASKTIRARQGGRLSYVNDQTKIYLAGNVRIFDDFPVTLAYKKGGKRWETGGDKMYLTC